jgi:hypothetical protein
MKKLASAVLLAAITMVCWAQGDVPTYHDKAPKKTEKLPPILPKDQLWGPSFKYPVQKQGYLLAAKIDNVLYQLPCYCHCDRSIGHKSLRSCFEDTHGAACGTCMQEVFYAYQEKKKGKTVAQIRQGIIRGEHEQVNLQTAVSIQ